MLCINFETPVNIYNSYILFITLGAPWVRLLVTHVTCVVRDACMRSVDSELFEAQNFAFLQRRYKRNKQFSRYD